MDTLSDVLALLKSHRSTVAGLKVGGTWAINFAAPDGIKFNAVVEGSCWLEVEGLAVPIRLSTGMKPGCCWTLSAVLSSA